MLARSGTREAVTGVDERVNQARVLYERVVYTGEAGLLAEADRELDAAEADLAVARGRLIHTRFQLDREADPAADEEDSAELPLFERATRLYRALGDVRGEAEALFWTGCLYQVVRHDDDAAVPLFERSLALASRAGDKAVMSEALRHLGIAAHHRGELETARERLEESTRLRRETGNWPGAVANMVGLVYIAAAQGRETDALALLDEAEAMAQAGQADRVRQQLSDARAVVSGQRAPGPA
ncbi:MAG TPA: tetratricopeptide repeat protein [Trebonia sp.]|nr:tetratricopeptide repeat protein [Trebonia sp.]